MNTPSDEAAKFYDAAITQLCGWYEDKSIGGIEGAVERMLKADPYFVLGHALDMELNLMGGLNAPRLSKQLSDKLSSFNKLAESKKGSLTELEKLHVKLVNNWVKYDLKQVSRDLEQIVTLYPQDLASIKMNQDTYFFLGKALPMRNSIANCLSKINKDNKNNPLKGYVHGMFAFALEESNMYPQAEQQALEALALVPRDTWAIHNYAHCLEMQGKTSEGLKWMQDRKCDWLPCESLACHQYWHTALFHINNNNFDDAIEILEQQVLNRCAENPTTLNLHDGVSMLFRMELVDLFGKASKPSGGDEECKKRWSKVYDVCKPHKQDHLIGFNDAHYLMSYLGVGDEQSVNECIDSIDGTPNLIEGQTVVKPLLLALRHFKEGQYEKCVELLEPIRFEIINIGGSHAQRDVFEQTLLVAGLRSKQAAHNKLAERMLSERDVFYGRRTVQTELLAQA